MKTRQTQSQPLSSATTWYTHNHKRIQWTACADESNANSSISKRTGQFIQLWLLRYLLKTIKLPTLSVALKPTALNVWCLIPYPLPNDCRIPLPVNSKLSQNHPQSSRNNKTQWPRRRSPGTHWLVWYTKKAQQQKHNNHLFSKNSKYIYSIDNAIDWTRCKKSSIVVH